MMQEENDFIAGMGCDSDKLYAEFLTLLSCFGGKLNNAKSGLAIRELDLSDTEKIALAIVYGRFVGTLSAVGDVREAVYFLDAIAKQVVERLEAGAVMK